ncbi:exodeoxyribonuclease VII large subunit [Pseudoroseicyclus aestuarii]|uniref:Exodeoxyribonuclease 7 large subunit n=1 Tax=Pseudoroseicyclus aestuarii TaxID=1795041 RepID=A0A318SV92_9RHOB|nr:exodeoxyribonuclease VII large subunit [Pseudoroseicyclus aestuarii]PYE85831.1 exodeoxyribonuclease VII large subunit [Pseudoroseicyclus aestuarii]
MDLFEDEAPKGGDNAHEFSVSEISGAVKKTVEGAFGHVRVRGELGRVTHHRSGHVYLDLKDERASLSGVIWRGSASKMETRPEEGMEVIATGRLTTFQGQSKYQMVIESLVPAGAGALMAMLEKRRKMLEGEGLFDPARKRPIPWLPEVIGVVTSPTGAVIRDILHRLRDRFPRKVLVWPVAVQGPNCAPDVTRAIRGFNALSVGGALPRPDLIIVARGGGSIEDLWGFNEESVVRAAAESAIPLISAVGHETDTTLIDHASDRRAPTPTAAAEIAVPVRAELAADIAQMGARLGQLQRYAMDRRGERLRDLSRGLPRSDALLQGPRQRLDDLDRRLPGALRAAIAAKRLALSEHPLRPALAAVPVARARDRVERAAATLPGAFRGGIAQRRLALSQHSLRPAGLSERLRQERRHAERVAGRLTPELVTDRLRRLSERLAALDRLRETLSHRATLERGFAVVRAGGTVVTDRASAAAAAELEIEFKDGRLTVGQGGGGSEPPAAPAPKAPRRKPASKPEQPDLF